MHSTNAAGATAHLKASPEQKRPFIAADIIDGEPAVGDRWCDDERGRCAGRRPGKGYGSPERQSCAGSIR